MRIKSIRIQNFRSISDATLECDPLTALIGENGAGKSTFLRALEVFYNPDASFDTYDFHKCDTENPIIITVTYDELNDDEKKAFSEYCPDKELLIRKEVTKGAGGKFEQRYFGQRHQNPASPAQWDEHAFFVSSKARAKPKNPILSEYTRFLFIPAIRDASVESMDKSGSVVNQLVNIIRGKLEDNEDVIRIKDGVAKQLKEVSDILSADLGSLKNSLTAYLEKFAPNSTVDLAWNEMSFQVPNPQVNVQISEDGYTTAIDRAGHGVQRAFVIAMLQQLAMSSQKGKVSSATSTASEEPTSSEPSFHLILAIEEPELFQHPSRQRHFARVLDQLAQSKGARGSVQVIYCTHSPHFVSIDRFENIRLIRKEALKSASSPVPPKTTTVIMKRKIPNVKSKQLGMVLDSAVNEGFFAKRIVLVEGGSDKAYLQMVARHCFEDLSLEAHGIVIIAVNGKNNLPNTFQVFNEFGIPVYLVWDNDKPAAGSAASGHNNQKLLKLLGHKPVVDWPEGIHDTHAIFSPKLEPVIKEEIVSAGIDWDVLKSEIEKVLDETASTKEEDFLKRPVVINYIVKFGWERGCRFPHGSAIIKKVVELHGLL